MVESLIHIFFFFTLNLYIITYFNISLLFKEQSVIFPSKNGILILNPSTISEALKTYPNLALLMYAPWCHQYEKNIQELEDTAKSKIVNNMNLTFAKIDVDQHTSIIEQYNISGFPTIIFFVNGEKKEIYNGERNKDSIIEWFYKRLINPIHLIESINDINEYQTKEKFSYVYFGNNKNNINIYKNFSLTQNIKFGLCQNLDILKNYNKLIEPESAIFYTPFYEPSYITTKDITSQNLKKIIKDNSYPLIYKDIEKLFFHSLDSFQPTFFFLRNTTDLKEKEYGETIKKIALKYKGKMKFCMGDINDNFVQKMLNNSKIKLNQENFPTGLIYDFDGSQKIWRYIDFYEKYNEKNLEEFIQNWDEKNLELLQHKSEEEPETQEEGKVYKLVYKTFKKDVLDNNLNVFIKFYIPNDTLCKEIEPIYEEVAKQLKPNRNIRIAEYNLEKNFFDYAKIEHYPTLLLFRAGLKKKAELIEYKGDKKAYDIIYFILTHQTFPILNQKKGKDSEEKNNEL